MNKNFTAKLLFMLAASDGVLFEMPYHGGKEMNF